MRTALIVLLLFLAVPSFAQVTGLDTNLTVAGYKVYDKAITGDFIKVDSLVKHMPKSAMRTSDAMVKYFKTFCTNDYEMVRAFYTFIGEYITYDYAKFKDRKNIKRQLSAKELLSSKQGVCGDVAILFRDLCRKADIPCVYVIGYTKQPLKFWTPKRKDVDHAWNAVRIDTTWYLVDATWGMKLNTKKKLCTEKVNYLFFISHPIVFIQNHLPADPSLQLLENPISYKYFKWHGLIKDENRAYCYDYNFTDTLNRRDSLPEDRAILLSALSAYEFNPKNKYIIGAIMFWHAEELLDEKKQGKRKFTLAEYKHARSVYEEAQRQFELLNTKKGKGAERYIEKKIMELDKKIAQQQKKLMKEAQKKKS
ncbi:MAG: transglutaminase domain-containing protein [Flavobacteriales bacterium]